MTDWKELHDLLKFWNGRTAVADAELIVRAVNSYAELLDALQETVSVLEHQGYQEYGNRWLREAHAAIAKAKGE